jgi:hypothetical protein
MLVDEKAWVPGWYLALGLSIHELGSIRILLLGHRAPYTHGLARSTPDLRYYCFIYKVQVQR